MLVLRASRRAETERNGMKLTASYHLHQKHLCLLKVSCLLHTMQVSSRYFFVQNDPHVNVTSMKTIIMKELTCAPAPSEEGAKKELRIKIMQFSSGSYALVFIKARSLLFASLAHLQFRRTGPTPCTSP